MESKDFAILLSPWLGIPLTALDFRIAWDRLPEKVPMKTGGHGQVLAWTTREGALSFDLKFLAMILLIVTFIGWILGMASSDKGIVGVVIAALTGWGIVLLLNWVLWSIQVG
jgi:hypothetical protein